jgi:hypothetical protein
MPTMWLSDSQSTCSPGFRTRNNVEAREIEVGAWKGASVCSMRHLRYWAWRKAIGSPLLTVQFYRDWSSILLGRCVVLLLPCLGAMNLFRLFTGGFFLICGVFMFFDRAMYVPSTYPLLSVSVSCILTKCLLGSQWAMYVPLPTQP